MLNIRIIITNICLYHRKYPQIFLGKTSRHLGFVTLYHGLCRHKNIITIKYLHTAHVTNGPQLLSIYDHMQVPIYRFLDQKLIGQHMEMHKEKLIITKWRYIKRISTIVSYARASYRVELERKSQNVSNYDKLIYICPYTGRKLYNMRKIQYRKANCA